MWLAETIQVSGTHPNFLPFLSGTTLNEAGNFSKNVCAVTVLNQKLFWLYKNGYNLKQKIRNFG